ncbi:peptide chain release factor 2 [Rhodococcus triatomae]|uniref:Peptide chain release factor 2 n=1 Tax=Rhodococcus triatomae TaxID=300028 RepID=A0A1G8F1U0_9NOCA|nr:peptide chain release factor 2 [Rhodococcus triatomae]QNG19363.1 peptide chain release factor 2 [Rhodococcus triatomae]QNG24724.1 peptide chain release factor 2 [Rhodococcus triatomae]SDH76103.1 bacterial peptide chain release factor 2 (bRF-2) [Rhodococcus triatomae]
MQPDVSADIDELDTTLRTVESVLDIEELRRRIDELEHQAADPSLWDDQEHAQSVTSELSHAQAELRRAEELRQRLEDLPLLYELAEEEGSADALGDADAERISLRTDIEAMEVKTMLSGEYDQRDALVNIRSGAGGVDAADWAEMLMRMYIRWAEKHGYGVEVYDTSYAEEAGIKSATFAVKAPYTYGTLSVEMGTHRLVRISPFDNQGRRQTSFAEVEVLPVVETTDHIDVNENDVRVDVYRSSGPGGQSVNTTDSAVRLTHTPTGIVVTCQNEKSQLQNKVSAMRVLQAKLLERKRQEERAEMDALKGDGGNSWGNQMRSYVLHPYQMVKDLRTEYEVNNPSSVLDGDIDGFLEAGIRWRMRENQA